MRAEEGITHHLIFELVPARSCGKSSRLNALRNPNATQLHSRIMLCIICKRDCVRRPLYILFLRKGVFYIRIFNILLHCIYRTYTILKGNELFS